ncbi:MAG: acyl carrier protein [Bacteroidia bacterium]|nr:acyl carrier protein [Bacteroidia bacterium]
MDKVTERLTGIFRTVFGNHNLVIKPEMTAADIDGWNSLAHLNLIVAVEKEFNIKISGYEVMTLKNIGDMINLINNKIQK